MLPSDIKEATEATQTNPIARTKLRLIHAVARVMFEMDPVAPPVAASVAVEPRSKMARTDMGLSLKIKVSSILDQSSDREVMRWSREELNFLRSRWRSLEGEDPMKSEEVTDDQLSVPCVLTKVGIAPFADFVWKPCGQRHAKTLRCKEIPGPDCFATWEACWRVFGTAAIMCDIAAPAVLDRCASRFKERVDRFSDAWHLSVLLTRDVGQSCGNLSAVANLNSTKAIQRSQHLFPTAHGAVLFVPRRTTAISGKRSWKTRWRISETCVKS